MRPRRFAVLALLLTGVAFAPEPALAALPCGPDKKATLTLIEAQTDNKAAFKPTFRPKSTQDLDLVFRVRGCALVNAEPVPKMIPETIKDQEKLPQAAVNQVTADTRDGATLALTVQITRSELDPGTYGGALAAQADYLTRNATPITVSETDSMWIPPAIGAIAGLVALLWVGLGKLVGRSQLQIKRLLLVVLALLAAAAGAWQGFTAYWDQEVWVADDNAIGTFTAAFSAASAGTIGAVLATAWKSPAQEEETEGEIAEEAPPQEAPQPPAAH
jgi:hypothetical protein